MIAREDLKRVLQDKTCSSCIFYAQGECLSEPFNRKKKHATDTCKEWKKHHRLNVTWTKESDIDLSTAQGIDVEDELLKIVGKEIHKQIEEQASATLRAQK
jgi:hypothetical protein